MQSRDGGRAFCFVFPCLMSQEIHPSWGLKLSGVATTALPTLRPRVFNRVFLFSNFQVRDSVQRAESGDAHAGSVRGDGGRDEGVLHVRGAAARVDGKYGNCPFRLNSCFIDATRHIIHSPEVCQSCRTFRTPTLPGPFFWMCTHRPVPEGSPIDTSDFENLKTQT